MDELTKPENLARLLKNFKENIYSVIVNAVNTTLREIV